MTLPAAIRPSLCRLDRYLAQYAYLTLPFPPSHSFSPPIDDPPFISRYLLIAIASLIAILTFPSSLNRRRTHVVSPSLFPICPYPSPLTNFFSDSRSRSALGFPVYILSCNTHVRVKQSRRLLPSESMQVTTRVCPDPYSRSTLISLQPKSFHALTILVKKRKQNQRTRFWRSRKICHCQATVRIRYVVF